MKHILQAAMANASPVFHNDEQSQRMMIRFHQILGEHISDAGKLKLVRELLELILRCARNEGSMKAIKIMQEVVKDTLQEVTDDEAGQSSRT